MASEEDGRDVGNGWFAYLTEEGDEYYYNEELDQTLWELPGSEQEEDTLEVEEDGLAQAEQGPRQSRAQSDQLMRKQSSGVEKEDVVRPSDPERTRRLTVDEVNSLHDGPLEVRRDDVPAPITPPHPSSLIKNKKIV